MKHEPVTITSNKPTKQEYFSDNSVSLPGILGQSGPVGFEPGMFNKNKDGDTRHKVDASAKVRIIFIFMYIFTDIYYYSFILLRTDIHFL